VKYVLLIAYVIRRLCTFLVFMFSFYIVGYAIEYDHMWWPFPLIAVVVLFVSALTDDPK